MLELGDTSGAADYQLGQARQAQGENERAIAAYRDALRRNPDSEEALKELMRLLDGAGRRDDAERFLQQHIASHPDLPLPRLLLGELYLADGEVVRARAAFQELAVQQPNAVGAYLSLASTHAEGSEDQVAALSRGLQENPGDPRLALALGSALKRRQDFDAAIAVYEDAVLVDDSNALIVNNLAVLLLERRSDQQSHERALELMSRFATGDAHPFNLGVLGWAYHRNGRSVEGVRYLERAVAEAGDNPKLRYYLGMAYLQAGDTVAARQQLEKAIAAADAAGGWFEGYEEAVASLETLESDDS